MSKKLELSQKNHIRLSNKCLDKCYSLKYGSKEHFYSVVNGRYHDEMIRFQQNRGSVAPLELRKKIYKRTFRDYALDVKYVISRTGEKI